MLNSSGELSNHVNTCNVESAVTGIKIRSRTARSQPGTTYFVTQGDAPRRIRLQRELQGVQSLNFGNAINNCNTEEKEDDSKPAVTKVRNL